MIARIWHGRTPAGKGDAYSELLRGEGSRGYRETAGNRGVFILRRDDSGVSDFILISLWESIEAIGRFAGPDVGKAVYYPWDDEFLLEKEPEVRHYEVLT